MALKVLRPGLALDAKHVDRFRREALAGQIHAQHRQAKERRLEQRRPEAEGGPDREVAGGEDPGRGRRPAALAAFPHEACVEQDGGRGARQHHADHHHRPHEEGEEERAE